MAITSTVRRATFAGDGIAVTFPFTFKVFAAADMQVSKTVGTTSTILTLTTDYTVTLNADQNAAPGGTITMLVAPQVGESLAVTSRTAKTQSVQLSSGGAFLPNVLNDAFDKATILAQEIEDQAAIDRANNATNAANALVSANNAAASAAAALVSENNAASSAAQVNSVGVALSGVNLSPITAPQSNAVVAYTETIGNSKAINNSTDSLFQQFQSILGLLGSGLDFGNAFGGSPTQISSALTTGFGYSFGSTFGANSTSHATGMEPNVLLRHAAQRFFVAQI